MSYKQLTWGVKASFRSYVEAAGGSITLSDGATRAADGAFVFAALPGGDLVVTAEAQPSGSMKFAGTVAFDAHGGMLRSKLTELEVAAENDGLVLSALDTQFGGGRRVIAELGAAEIGPEGEVILSAAITLDGMDQIADNYPPGTALDPLRLD